jgi:hypothetical protein
MPAMPSALTSSSTERVEMPWTPGSGCAGPWTGSGLLDHRRERLLRDPPRLQETRKVAALPELGNAQLDRPGAGLPAAGSQGRPPEVAPERRAIAIAVALRQPARRTLAIAGAGQALHLELHQALGGKADHLTQEIGVGALLQELAQGDAVIGHRGGPRSVVAGQQPNPTGDPAMATRCG